MWDKTDEKTQEMNLGSRLKTPVLPIWVTCVNDDWGVLFNTNKDLMKSYSAENRLKFLCFFKNTNPSVRFPLYYFNNRVSKEKKETILMVDTRGNKTRNNMAGFDDFEDLENDPLEDAIQSK